MVTIGSIINMAPLSFLNSNATWELHPIYVAPWADYVPSGHALCDWAAIAALPPSTAIVDNQTNICWSNEKKIVPTVGRAYLSQRIINFYKRNNRVSNNRFNNISKNNNKILNYNLNLKPKFYNEDAHFESIVNNGIKDPINFYCKYFKLILNNFKNKKWVGPLTYGQHFAMLVREAWLVHIKRAYNSERALVYRNRNIANSLKAHIAQNKHNYNILSEEVLSSEPSLYKFKNIKYVKKVRTPRVRTYKIYKVKDTSCRHDSNYIISLKIKLRQKILSFRNNNFKFSICKFLNYNNVNSLRNIIRACNIRIIPQMDLDAHGNTGGETDKAGNVTIEQQDEIIFAAQCDPVTDWLEFTSSDTITKSDNMTDRWIGFDNWVWKKDEVNKQSVHKYWVLPKAIIQSVDKEMCNTPNFIPFKVHAYSHFDMVIRILVNSNKFQSGCLQFSYIYQAAHDAGRGHRENMFSLSQTNHVRVYAGTANEAELYIPFKYSLSSMFNQPSPRVNDVMNLGCLYCCIINPLKMGNNVSQQVNINMQVKFVNASFTGMRSGNLPQMMSTGAMIAAYGAMRLIDTVMPDPNRDNPPLNAESPFLVPTASHSWSAGTGRVDIPKLLRLDTRGQTHHPSGAQSNDPFTVSNLCNVFGLLSTVKIELAKVKLDDQLGSLDIEPMFGKSFNPFAENYETKLSYALPPISVVSSCFMYWRGEIDIQIDVVCSQFHTFKLLIAYIPNPPLDDTKVTRTMAQNSPHVIFSVEGPKLIGVRVPYVSNQMWWPRTFTGNYSTVSASAPSKLYVFMVNPPMRQDSASDTIYMNFYVKGGPSFEVSVPVQPSLGLATSVYFYGDHPFSPINPLPTSAKVKLYIGQAYSLTHPHYRIFVQNDAQFAKDNPNLYALQYPAYSKFDSGSNTKPERMIHIVEMKYEDWDLQWFDTGNKIVTMPQFGTLLNINNKSLMLYASSKRNAYHIAEYIQNKGYRSLAMIGILPSDYFWDASLGNGYAFELTHNVFTDYKFKSFEHTPYYLKDNVYTKFQLIINSISGAQYADMDNIIPNAGEREVPAGGMQVLSMGRSLRTTGMGYYGFGESFNDLLTLCRRYQLYGRITLTQDLLTNYDKCAFYFTCNPQGLGNSVMVDQGRPVYTFNICRDGIIPLLLSGFRYFRGGLRFRLVFPSCSNTLVWIQHRPDRKSIPRELTVCTKLSTGQSVFNHGYAFELQLANINSIIEIEVPFYQYDHYGLLQIPDPSAGQAFDYQFGLGQVCVGLKCSDSDRPKFINRPCEIYYSLADDFSPSTFYGFPRMIFLDDLPEVTPPDESSSEFSQFEFLEAAETQAIMPQGPIQAVKNYFNTSVENTVQTVTESVKSSVSAQIEDIKEEMSSSLKDLQISKSKQLTIINILSNLIHCVLNMSLYSVATSIISIFSSLGLLLMEKFQHIFDVVTRICKRLIGAKKQTNEISAQGPDASEEADIASWVSCLYGGVCSFFSIKGAMSQDKDQIGYFMKTFSFGMRGANSLFTFIKNSFTCLKSIFNWCLKKICPEYRLLRDLEFNNDHITMWLKESLYLVDPMVFNKRYADKMYVDRVYSAYEFGCIFIATFQQSKLEQKIIGEVHRLFSKLGLIRADLEAMGEHPHVRREPFGIYVFGEPGIGKSCLREKVCVDLLQEANYKFDSCDVFCIINASDKFWSQCRNQPVLVIDDLWNIQAGENIYLQVEMMYRIFSSVILCPPKAAVEEKSMRYNPNIVWMNSNYSRVSVNGVDDDAINRRRHIVIEAVRYEPCDEKFFKKDCPHCKDPSMSLDLVPEHFLADFHHLRFFVHTQRLSPDATTRGNMLTYSEVFNIVKEHYLKFNTNETLKFQRSVSMYKDLISETCTTNPFDEGKDLTFLTKYTAAVQKANELELAMYKEARANVLVQCSSKFYDWLNNFWKPDWYFDSKPRCKLTPLQHINVGCSFLDCKGYKTPAQQIAETAVEAKDPMLDPKVQKLLGNSPVTASEEKPAAIAITSNVISQKVQDFFKDKDKILPQGDNVELPSSSNATKKVIGYRWPIIQCEAYYEGQEAEFARWKESYPKLYTVGNNPTSAECEYETKIREQVTDADDYDVLTPAQELEITKIAGPKVNIIKLKEIPKYKEFFNCCGKLSSLPEYNHQDYVQKFFYWNFILINRGVVSRSAYNDHIRLLCKFDMNATDIYFENFSKLLENYISVVVDKIKDFPNTPFELYRALNVYHLKMLGVSDCYHCAVPYSDFFVSYGDLRMATTDIKNSVSDQYVVHNVCCFKTTCIANSAICIFLLHHAWVRSSHVHFRALRNDDYLLLPNYFKTSSAFKSEELFSWIDSLKEYLTYIWKTKISPSILRMYTFMKDYLHYIIAIISLGAICYSTYTADKLVACADRDIDARNSMYQQMREERTNWDKPQNLYDPSSTKHSSSSALKLQGSQQVTVVENKIRRNTFFIDWINDETGQSCRFRCFSLGGKNGIGLRHYKEQMDFDMKRRPGKHSLWFRYNLPIKAACDSIQLDATEFLSTWRCASRISGVTGIPGSNIVAFKLPKIIADFPNLKKFVATYDDIQHVSSNGLFVFGDAPSREINLRYDNIASGIGCPIAPVVTEDTYCGPINLRHWWKYNCQRVGYCGSLILSTNLERPIVGVHVGGSDLQGYGFGEILTREIAEGCPYLDTVVKGVELPPIKPFSTTDIRFQSNITLIGHVDRVDAQIQPRETKLTKTLLHGMFPVETAPNPLSPYDKRLPPECDPLACGVSKHGIFVKSFPIDIMQAAYADLRNLLLSVVKPIMPVVSVLSDQVAICGDPSIPEWDAMAWDTSVGYPMKRYKPPGASGKRWCFELTQGPQGYQLHGFHPELALLLAEQRAMRVQAIKPFTVFSDCLKDTCIAVEKCYKPGKTRIFSISPIQYTIEYKKYFGSFMGAYRRHRIKNESAIGINPDSVEWSQLLSYLLQVSDTSDPKFVVGDYSNFGPGLNLDAVEFVQQVMVDWNEFHGYTDSDLLICKILNSEILSRYHLCDDVIYYPPAGAPSGGPSTDIINTMVNGFYIRCAWLAITKQNFERFRQHVRVVFYGDDLVMCISSKYCDIFNGITISNFFASYDIVFTDVSKSGLPIKYKSLSEIDFIKRKFTIHPTISHIFLAPIDLKSIHSCLNWCHKSLAQPLATEANLNSFRELMFGHGPDLYDEYNRAILKRCLDLNINFKYIDWLDISHRNYLL